MTEASETKFISTSLHKLRTPLNAILGFSELLMEQIYGTLNEKQIHYIKNIHSSGETLLNFLNDLMDLINFRWVEPHLNYSDFSLSLAINEACESVKTWAAKKNISLQIKNGENLGIIRADESKFMKILNHLLSNAIKFTQDGGKVAISTQLIETSPDHVPSRLFQPCIEVTVADTGIGIKSQDHEKIFFEFYQVDPNRSLEFEGTGLGLCITRELVKLHQGKIWVESEEGQGSKFFVLIPKF
jgi:signal transduction histidine kinase